MLHLLANAHSTPTPDGSGFSPSTHSPETQTPSKEAMRESVMLKVNNMDIKKVLHFTSMNFSKIDCPYTACSSLFLLLLFITLSFCCCCCCWFNCFDWYYRNNTTIIVVFEEMKLLARYYDPSRTRNCWYLR